MRGLNARSIVLYPAAGIAVAVSAGACGGGPPRSCLLPEAAAELDRPAWIRSAAPEAKIDPPECAVNADCGVRPHAEMTCFHDASCMAICERHWGDCNKDYRDGCETPIQHALYCDGDPRIAEEAKREPSAFFAPDGESTGPGQFSASALSRGLGRVEPALKSCYQRVLQVAPDAQGTLSYRLAINERGCIAANLVHDEVHNQDLVQCALRAFADVRFSAGPVGGAVTYPCSVIFLNGAPLPEELPERTEQ